MCTESTAEIHVWLEILYMLQTSSLIANFGLRKYVST